MEPAPTSANPAPNVPALSGDSSGHVARSFMTKVEFYYKIKEHFMADRATWLAESESVHLRSELASATRLRLLACVQAASERFGGELSRVESDESEAQCLRDAISWVQQECLAV
ncbi:hypothetical protein ATCC90586_002640 [Pythium insidiosum]|nr:hypothetical protein ATCC90586_002640 [Pythium insidiosum]